MIQIPYISPHRREELDWYPNPETDGELNFVLVSMVLKYLGPEPRYDDYAAGIAALECAKLELYRRAVSPYEDKAVKRNGDLPWPPR